MEFIITCPHCSDYIIIKKINCGIFRHVVLIKTGKQIDPHASKEICDELITKKLIFGCGKPFKVVKKEDGVYITEICEYI